MSRGLIFASINRVSSSGTISTMSAPGRTHLTDGGDCQPLDDAAGGRTHLGARDLVGRPLHRLAQRRQFDFDGAQLLVGLGAGDRLFLGASAACLRQRSIETRAGEAGGIEATFQFAEAGVEPDHFDLGGNALLDHAGGEFAFLLGEFQALLQRSDLGAVLADLLFALADCAGRGRQVSSAGPGAWRSVARVRRRRDPGATTAAGRRTPARRRWFRRRGAGDALRGRSPSPPSP